MARQTGATTTQIQSAPRGAVFIWVSDDVSYPKELALKLGRDDLEVVGPSWIDGMRWAGRELSGLALDHAARLTAEQWHYFTVARTRVRGARSGESLE